MTITLEKVGDTLGVDNSAPCKLRGKCARTFVSSLQVLHTAQAAGSPAAWLPRHAAEDVQ
eukprot:3084408-Amphidinium_carterae.1